MVIVKRCQVCGRENAPHNLLCEGCATSLAMVPVEQKEDLTADPVEPVTPKEGEGTGYITCWNCGTRVPITETSCIRCAMPLARCVPESQPPCEMQNKTIHEDTCYIVIRFPWGDIFTNQRLGIGRDEKFSSIAAQLSLFKRVSREHAIISRDGERFTIRDADSLNHTFVNGARLALGESIVLHTGDKLQFSSEVTAEIIELGGKQWHG